jgi:hypothetical protein
MLGYVDSQRMEFFLCSMNLSTDIIEIYSRFSKIVVESEFSFIVFHIMTGLNKVMDGVYSILPFYKYC